MQAELSGRIMKTPRDVAKDLMCSGWKLGDPTMWECKEYQARIGKRVIPPHDYVIVVLRMGARECFEIFSLEEILKAIRDEEHARLLSLWDDWR